MLAIEVRYLAGVVSAADFRDRATAEWPPHPARLFSALVASAYESGLMPEAREALQWLELQSPPAIACSTAHERDEHLAFVPVNDATKLQVMPQHRGRQPRNFPATVPDDPRVFFIWQHAEPPAQVGAALLRILSNVTRLGSSRSFVAARLTDEILKPSYAPDVEGNHQLRVVGSGRLDELDALFAAGRRPTPGIIQRYRYSSVETNATTVSTASPFQLFVLRISGKRRYPVGQTLLLTETLRAAVLAQAGDDASELIHGHGKQPHCAWLGLPFVGHPHADGRLLGLGIAIPLSAPTIERRQLLRAVGQVKLLQMGERGEVTVETSLDDSRVALKAETWCRPAKRWATVTPVVLDRFPHEKRPGQSTADVLLKSLRQFGLPEPEQLAFGEYSPIAGVPPAKAFATQREGKKMRPWLHVDVTFATPVAGPLLIGANRHFGLGLLRPIGS